MKKSDIHIIIIDDRVADDAPLVIELKKEFEQVYNPIEDPNDGIEFVTKHIGEKAIIILDIDFGDYDINGYDVLKKIREKTALTEIILWSAHDQAKGQTSIEKIIQSLVIEKPFAFVVRDANTTKDLLEQVREAKLKIETSVAAAVEEWIKVKERDRRNIPYQISIGEDNFTLEAALKEIRLETGLGKKLEHEIRMLAIDILLQENRKSKV